MSGETLRGQLPALSRGEGGLPLSAELAGHPLRLEAVLRALPDRRLVLRVCWGERVGVLKVFLDATRAERHLAREQEGLAALTAAGLPTPERLWQGHLAGFPALLTAWVEGARGLGKDFGAASSAQLARLGELWARLHRAGLLHDDPHGDNVLFAGEALYLLDGDAVKAAADDAARRDNLARLLAQLPLPRREAQRALAEAYGTSLDEPGLAQALRAARRDRARRHAAKAFRNASDFVAEHDARHHLHLARAFDTPELRALLSDPDAAMAGGRLLKDGRTCTVARVDCGGQALVIKRYNRKSAAHAIVQSLRRGRAAISWRNAHYLRALGLPTPAPVALLERRLGPLRGTAYYITAYQPAWRPDDHFRDQGLTAGWRELEAMAALVNALGAVGLSHGDLKAGNFLVCEGGDVQLIDLDAMRLHESIPAFRRAYARDLRRFLHNWQQDPELLRAFRQKLQPALGLVGREP
ncbi:lipopolysaccharide kinase InaA family protein [Alkalilimnicola sp. S0819]|uniref:lipopolysaccharide kinase InaA family protein n=1 Tax=Alkalilimnicola sp. S0819 TaxID=2613922 RepID=UPI001261C8A5|nr:lipopolysaccharide kinase InaA family protein [Alkalilimnicola sp. S0819]KAB7627333.1 hypothetical protein F3N43_05315 [Alkalilimnicola sp. S0819]MPQ16049.1 hypothetical protein [Alkalilimnicola sp. S0819]